MSLNPGYGETPVDGDELGAIEPSVLESFGGIPTKKAIHYLEQGTLAATRARFLSEINRHQLHLEDILTTSFLVELHRNLFSGIWSWAGAFRQTGLNIGVDPHLISTELHASFGNLLYQWRETKWLATRELGIATHAELVRIHPFVDGNGRVTRLMADLVFAAVQPQPHAFEYDWNVDKSLYIQLLRDYDLHRDPRPLASIITTFELEK